MSRNKRKFEVLQDIIFKEQFDYYDFYYYSYYDDDDDYDYWEFESYEVYYEYLPSDSNIKTNYRKIDMMSFYEKDVLRQKKIDYILNTKNN